MNIVFGLNIQIYVIYRYSLNYCLVENIRFLHKISNLEI